MTKSLTLPYSHSAALCQLPVLYKVQDETLTLYPLTMRSCLEMDQWLQQKFLHQYDDRVEALPEAEQAEFVASLHETVSKLTFQHGERRCWETTFQGTLEPTEVPPVTSL